MLPTPSSYNAAASTPPPCPLASGYQNRVHKKHAYLIICPQDRIPQAFLSDRLSTWGGIAARRRPAWPRRLPGQRSTLPKRRSNWNGGRRMQFADVKACTRFPPRGWPAGPVRGSFPHSSLSQLPTRARPWESEKVGRCSSAAYVWPAPRLGPAYGWPAPALGRD